MKAEDMARQTRGAYRAFRNLNTVHHKVLARVCTTHKWNRYGWEGAGRGGGADVSDVTS